MIESAGTWIGLGIVVIGVIVAFALAGRRKRVEVPAENQPIQLRQFQRVIVEFPSGPLRDKLERLNLAWTRLLNEPGSAPSGVEPYQLDYAESLVGALRNVLNGERHPDPRLEEAVDELVTVFEDLEANRHSEAKDRLEAGLEVIRLLGPAGPRD